MLPEILKKTLTSVCSAVLVLAACLSTAPARADGTDLTPYDWTFVVETRKVNGQFDYPGSGLKDIVRCDVSYFYNGNTYPHDDNHPDEAHKKPFETMWFNKKRPLGLERKCKFSVVEKSESICIRVRHKADAPQDILAEAQATAGLVMRMYMDAAVNLSPVASVRLPDGQPYDDVISELQARGALTADAHMDEFHSLHSAMNMFLKEDTGSRSTTLYFD